jgi:hypothetical protein
MVSTSTPASSLLDQKAYQLEISDVNAASVKQTISLYLETISAMISVFYSTRYDRIPEKYVDVIVDDIRRMIEGLNKLGKRDRKLKLAEVKQDMSEVYREALVALDTYTINQETNRATRLRNRADAFTNCRRFLENVYSYLDPLLRVAS